MDWSPFVLSVKLAAMTTLILLLVSFPLAYLLSQKKFFGKALLESVAALPLVLPPTVIGFYILQALSPRSFFGGFLLDHFHLQFLFSFTGILIGACVHSLPFMVQPLKTGFQNVDSSLVEASSMLGKHRGETFIRITLPLMKFNIFSGILMTFIHTIGEFGVVLMVGGAIPGVTKVASIALYEKVESMDYSSAGKYALILIVIGFVALFLSTRLNQLGNPGKKT